jgi:hypothetical protein
VSNDSTDGFFDETGRNIGPYGSADFKKMGASYKGELIEKFKIDYVKVGEKDPEKDRDGNVIKQLVLVLRTDLRDWEGVSKTPTDKDGKKVPNDQDTGLRAIYARPFTNIFAAIREAILATGVEKPGSHPLVGGKVAVQYFKDEDTGKPSPLKHFRAKYEPPVETKKDDDQDWGDPGGSSAIAADEPVGHTPDPLDEPPF